MNIDHPYKKERQRVELLAEKYEALFSLITSSISDHQKRYKTLLCLSDLEKLVIQSPEYIYNNEFSQLKFAILGDDNSGWNYVLTAITGISGGLLNLKAGIRLKSEKLLADNTECLLILRHEIESTSNVDISDWADCGIFPFDLDDEQSLQKALISRKIFRQHKMTNKNYCPLILVGCRDLVPNCIDNWNFYTNMKCVAVENEFDEYFEFQKPFPSDNSFMIEYCVTLASKCRKGFIPTNELADLEDDKEIIDKTTSLNKGSKRKTDIRDNSDNGSSKKKRYSIAGSITRNFSMKARNLILPIVNCPPIYDYSKDLIVKQDNIMKSKSSVVLTLTVDGKLYYHNSKNEFDKKLEPKFIDLSVFTPKIPGNNFQNGYTKQSKPQTVEQESSLKIELLGQGNKGKKLVYTFKAANENEQHDWMEKIIEAKTKLISQIVIEKPDILADKTELLNQIRSKYGNNVCAECSSGNPNWIVYNFGILVCDRCSGDHRNLGVEYSKIGSLTLDGLDHIKLKILESFGNCLVNSVMEAKLILTEDRKPTPGDKSVIGWLKNKYINKKYVTSVKCTDDIGKQLVSAISKEDRRGQLISLVTATTEQLNRPFSDDDSRTPLMMATCYEDIAVVQLLLWKNVDTSLRDNNGNDVYHYARMEIQKLLEKYKINS